ncbi:MAG: DNA-deoxyinosine glycosylase [Burkholderiales bacterium]
MKKLESFQPISSKNARVLILGSMPGERSLEVGQYYAHRRNAFWKIMQAITGLEASAGYGERVRFLKDHAIAVWDVLHSCHRKGSLDAAIEAGSVKANDFNAFFRRHPGIHTVLFNGAAAERYYRQYVVPKVGRTAMNLLRMPSTSPAHAALSFKQKVSAWRKGIGAQQAAAHDRVKKRGT